MDSFETTNLILVAQTDSGKSHLATCIGRKACQEGYKMKFTSVGLLFEEIAEAKVIGRFLTWLKGIKRNDAIIFDDLGLKTLCHEEATQLVEILEEGYEHQCFITKSQVDPKG